MHACTHAQLGHEGWGGSQPKGDFAASLSQNQQLHTVKKDTLQTAADTQRHYQPI